jgi:hypothetical protein
VPFLRLCSGQAPSELTFDLPAFLAGLHTPPSASLTALFP